MWSIGYPGPSRPAGSYRGLSSSKLEDEAARLQKQIDECNYCMVTRNSLEQELDGIHRVMIMNAEYEARRHLM